MLRLITPQVRAPLAQVGVRAFSSTPKRFIFENAGLPQPPGYITGTVNDATKVPAPHKMHGSYHWTFERIVALCMGPLVMSSVFKGELPPMADAALGTLLVAHFTMGFGACITDYVPKRRFPKLHPACFYLLYSGSALALYGVYKLETEEEGIVPAVKSLWKA